jgi:hypothetical protein
VEPRVQRRGRRHRRLGRVARAGQRLPPRERHPRRDAPLEPRVPDDRLAAGVPRPRATRRTPATPSTSTPPAAAA